MPLDQVTLHLDKQRFYAGELVTGQVVLSVFSSLQLSSINLKMGGTEHVEFIPGGCYQLDRNYSGQPTYAKSLFKESGPIFRRQYELYAAKTTLVSGTYAFPFQLNLSKSLTGTTDYDGKSDFPGAKATIEYGISAEVIPVDSKKPYLSHALKLIVFPALSDELMEAEIAKETNVSLLCCIPRGQVSVIATLEKNEYSPGEKITMNLNLDNSQSKVDIESISFRLVRTIRIAAEGYYKEQIKAVSMTKVKGVLRGEKSERQLVLDVPRNAEASCDGQKFKCLYVLITEFHIPFSPNVTLEATVQVVAVPQMTVCSPLLAHSAQVMPLVEVNTLHYKAY